MIENTMTYELRPNLDQQAYGEWAKKTIGVILQAPGVVEFRANRNLLGSPEHSAPSVRTLKIFDITQVTTTKTLQFRHAVLGSG